MSFINTINGYLSTKKEDNRNVYSPRINSFAKFLQEEKNVTDKNYMEYLSALKMDVILESLGYFIKNNQINKKSVAYFYGRTLKRYFQYLGEIGIENENLRKIFAYTNKNSKSYDNQIKHYIENHSELKNVETKDAIDFEDAKFLSAEIDEQIAENLKKPEVMTCTESRLNPYNSLINLLALKLILFTGIDYNGLITLPSNCLDNKKIKITINSYTLHLPDKLGEQLIEYEDIKNKRQLSGETFFVPSNRNVMKTQTSDVSYIIEQTLGRGDITGIRKYVITELIRNGVNQSFIMKLTGAGQTLFTDCQNTVNKERHIEANRYIDSKIRNMMMFDYL